MQTPCVVLGAIETCTRCRVWIHLNFLPDGVTWMSPCTQPRGIETKTCGCPTGSGVTDGFAGGRDEPATFCVGVCSRTRATIPPRAPYAVRTSGPRYTAMNQPYGVLKKRLPIRTRVAPGA